VDAVSAPDHHRVAMGVGQIGHRLEQRRGCVEQQIAGVA
jgi:hypothetical protein